MSGRGWGVLAQSAPNASKTGNSFAIGACLASYHHIMVHTESSSTLASLFKLKDENSVSYWSESKLGECYPYSQLHAKYWGKSMAIEEQEWRNSQDAKEVDDSDPESETGLGCYPLDFQLDLWGSRLWIRKDYVRMYDFCNQWYDSQHLEQTNIEAPSVVITGQSGIV
jgi:hypothetical protein